MKHLKRILDAYRATTNDCAAELEATFSIILSRLESSGTTIVDRLRVEKVLAAVIADMRDGDDKAAARAAAMAKVK